MKHFVHTISLIVIISMLIMSFPIGASANNVISDIKIEYSYSVEERTNNPGTYVVKEDIRISELEDGFYYAVRDRKNTSEMYFASSPVGEPVGDITAPCAYDTIDFWVFDTDQVLVSSWQSGPILEIIKIKKDNWNVPEGTPLDDVEEMWDSIDCVVYGYTTFVRPLTVLNIETAPISVGDAVRSTSVSTTPPGHKTIQAVSDGWYDDPKCEEMHDGVFTDGLYYLKMKVSNEVNAAFDPLCLCEDKHKLYAGGEVYTSIATIQEEGIDYVVFPIPCGERFAISFADMNTDSMTVEPGIRSGALNGMAYGGAELTLEGYAQSTDGSQYFIQEVLANGENIDFQYIGNYWVVLTMPQEATEFRFVYELRDTIFVDPNGGRFGHPVNEFVDETKSDIRISCEELYEGYHLVSLNTAPDGSGTNYLPDEHEVYIIHHEVNMQHDEIVLYAIWEKDHPAFIAGDVNGDNIVDGRDIIRLRKYLASYDSETGTADVEIFPGANVNEDGKIDGRDLIRLRKVLLDAE